MNQKKFYTRNKIVVPAPTSKPPLFDYIAFTKMILTRDIDEQIKKVLKNNRGSI